MCQAAPGPRCYADTSKVLRTRAQKLEVKKTKLAAAIALQNKAASSKDFTGYARQLKAVEALTKDVKELETIRRYDRRDAYGTKTGAARLDAKIKNASDNKEYDYFRNLKIQAEALRFSRTHALERKQSGYVPAIRLSRAA